MSTLNRLHKRPLPADLLQFARDLRHEQTDAETKLWRLLRNRRLGGAKFRRQHPVGRYVLDFYCMEHRIAVELDGSQHSLPDHQKHDEQRSRILAEQKICVLRFWNNQVLQETEAVAQTIYTALFGPEPPAETPPVFLPPLRSPSPPGRGVRGEGKD